MPCQGATVGRNDLADYSLRITFDFTFVYNTKIDSMQAWIDQKRVRVVTSVRALRAGRFIEAMAASLPADRLSRRLPPLPVPCANHNRS